MTREEHEHVVSPATYVIVLALLMLLLALTLTAAFFDFDRILHAPYWSMTIALLIAITKAVLIILIFMHVRYAGKITWAFAGAAFVWLGIMMTLSLSDYMTRQYPPGTPLSSPMQPDTQFERTPRGHSLAGP